MGSAHHDPAELRRRLELRQSEKLAFQQLSERSGVPVHVLTYLELRVDLAGASISIR